MTISLLENHHRSTQDLSCSSLFVQQAEQIHKYRLVDRDSSPQLQSNIQTCTYQLEHPFKYLSIYTYSHCRLYTSDRKSDQQKAKLSRLGGVSKMFLFWVDLNLCDFGIFGPKKSKQRPKLLIFVFSLGSIDAKLFALSFGVRKIIFSI